MNHYRQSPHYGIILASLLLSMALLLMLPISTFATDDGNDVDLKKTIIAARGGARGALANSLPALVLAAGTEVEYISFDIVATRDHQLIVHHTLDLGPSTDVAEKFPEHARDDGRFLSTDFTLDEIRLLRKKDTSDFSAPTNISAGIATFAEYLALAKYLEKHFSKQIGLAPNLIHPGYHRNEGIDISSLCLNLLNKFGYNKVNTGLLLQSMDADELQRISKELLPRLNFTIPLIQQIGSQSATTETDKEPLQDYDQAWMFTRLGARMISSYGSGIIMDSSLLHDPTGAPLNTEFLDDIRALAIPVYGYVHDITEPLPTFAEDLAALYDFYLTTLNLDGVSTSAYKEFSLHQKQKEEANRRHKLPIFPLKPLP
ncbi:glycerophosphodiester phosphodiesterase family protein [Desulfopila sp. IMCC35008]|uniref:glycerophosphodiester phosphodiesterase family protein n=1 Tax=Desulfopila sp. IMCC35008 TaxID=2653858 RepID=UPI0013D0D349|nr:glycerophosphodiester phosphodiesterase family protein [Desulfopila sp. IMCC35008]